MSKTVTLEKKRTPRVWTKGGRIDPVWIQIRIMEEHNATIGLIKARTLRTKMEIEHPDMRYNRNQMINIPRNLNLGFHGWQPLPLVREALGKEIISFLKESNAGIKIPKTGTKAFQQIAKFYRMDATEEELKEINKSKQQEFWIVTALFYKLVEINQ